MDRRDAARTLTMHVRRSQLHSIYRRIYSIVHRQMQKWPYLKKDKTTTNTRDPLTTNRCDTNNAGVTLTSSLGWLSLCAEHRRACIDSIWSRFTNIQIQKLKTRIQIHLKISSIYVFWGLYLSFSFFRVILLQCCRKWCWWHEWWRLHWHELWWWYCW